MYLLDIGGVVIFYSIYIIISLLLYPQIKQKQGIITHFVSCHKGGMQMSKTNLAVSIETTEDLIRRYNENVCNMLADPQVLAYILVNTMEEFINWRIPDVINTISDIAVRNVYVNPGYSNMGKIVGEQTVDLVPGEGEIRYDIRFSVQYGEECIRILLNLEAQKTTNAKKLNYHIENRIQYYLARMVSAQKNTEFTNDNYDDIKKTVSIWICMDADKNCDGITKYSFKPDTLYGKEIIYSEFNKMQAYIIRIRKRDNVEESKNKLIQMLETLFSKRNKEEVKHILSTKHGLVMEIPGTEQEVNKMCNLGEALYEEAKQEGMERGMERGAEQALVNQIIAKLNKGMDIPSIAEMLETDEDYIKELIEKHELMAVKS